jgi:type II secretory pathway component GspD/PulD (secretin)
MRAILLSVALLVLTGFIAMAGERNHEQSKGRYFQLDCVLVEFNSQGQKKVISRPSLACWEGKPATFANEGQVAHELKDGRDVNIEYIPIGFTATMTLRVLKNGKIRLDMTIEDSKVLRNSDILRVKKTSLRSIETTRLGETVRIEMDRDNDTGGSYEFQVRVLDPTAKD